MQFISVSRRRTESFTDEQFAVHIPAERQRVRELYQAGAIRAIWSRSDAAGAVMLLEAENLAAAWEAVNSLPLAQRNMLDVQILPLAPYPAFFPIGD